MRRSSRRAADTGEPPAAAAMAGGPEAAAARCQRQVSPQGALGAGSEHHRVQFAPRRRRMVEVIWSRS